MKYTYAIIHKCSQTLFELREPFEEHDDFNCVGLSHTLSDLENLVLKKNPDLFIIGIDEEPNEIFQAIDGLHQYTEHLPKIVGASKDIEKAFRAIKSGFFDYWLLPINDLDITKTILKFRKQVSIPTPTKICLKTYSDYHYLDTEEILYLKADNNATDFFLKDGRKISAYKTLKSFEHSLPDTFIRVHQSYIINSRYVSRINYGKSTCSLQNNKAGLPFSKSYKEKIDELKALLSKNSISTFS